MLGRKVPWTSSHHFVVTVSTNGYIQGQLLVSLPVWMEAWIVRAMLLQLHYRVLAVVGFPPPFPYKLLYVKSFFLVWRILCLYYCLLGPLFMSEVYHINLFTPRSSHLDIHIESLGITEKIAFKSWAKKLANNGKIVFFFNAFCDHFQKHETKSKTIFKKIFPFSFLKWY